MKVVVNKCYGGFSISKKAAEFMAVRGNEKAKADLASRGRFYGYDYERTDPDLIAAIESLGEDANGDCAELRITEIPDGISYEIQEYDGKEWIAETHRTW